METLWYFSIVPRFAHLMFACDHVIMLFRTMAGDEGMSEQESMACRWLDVHPILHAPLHVPLMQEKQLRDCFAKFDSNGDGKIQATILRGLVLNSRHHAAFCQADEFKKLMSSLGGFSPKDLHSEPCEARFKNSGMGRFGEEIKRLFKEADTDCSNSAILLLRSSSSFRLSDIVVLFFFNSVGS